MIVNQQSGLYLGGNAQYAGFGGFNPYDYLTGGTTPTPPTPTPTPTPTPQPATQSGHIVWSKVAGEWSLIEREKDRLPEKLVEHLKSLANERSQSIQADAEPSRKATPWSKAATSSKADVLKYMGLSSKKDADSALRTESAKAMKLRRMIEEEDEFLIHFDGFI